MKPSAPIATAPTQAAANIQDIRPVKTQVVAPIPVKAAPGSVPGVNPMVENPVSKIKNTPAPAAAQPNKQLDKDLKDVSKQMKDHSWLKKKQKKPSVPHQHHLLAIAIALTVGATLVATAVMSFRQEATAASSKPATVISR